MQPLKKPRKNYLFLSLSISFLSVASFWITYSMVENLIEKPDILRYARGGVDGIGIFAAILFAIIAMVNAYCFMTKHLLPCHIDRIISKAITYYAGFIIAAMPISGYVITHKIKDIGYTNCNTKHYTIIYAKNEKACEKYRNRHNFRNDD